MASSDMGDFESVSQQLGESNGVALSSDGLPISSYSNDECVILDSDPNKIPFLAVNGREDDDLKIIGEKGEVACRDYPHPRYLCTKFPFASTPHELHCVQCHCYVCDSPAPCSQWDTNISSSDHCHASYKEECWRAERILVKRGDMPVPNNISGIQALLQPHEFPKLDPPQPKPLPLNQSLKPVTTNSPSFSASNGVGQGGVHHSGFSVPIPNPQSQLVSPQPYPTFGSSNIASSSRDSYNNNNNNACNVRSLGSPSMPHRTSFKRTGLVGSWNNRHGYGPQSSMDSSPVWRRSFDTPTINVGPGPASNQLNIRRNHFALFVLPQPEPSSQTWSSPYSSPSLIASQMHFQSRQPYVNANFMRTQNLESWIQPVPGVVYGPSNVVGSQSSVFHQSFVGNDFRHQIVPSMNGQNDLGQGNQSGIGVGVSSTGSGSGSNQQISSSDSPTRCFLCGGNSCFF